MFIMIKWLTPINFPELYTKKMFQLLQIVSNFHSLRSFWNWILVIFCTWTVYALPFLLLTCFVVLFRWTATSLDYCPAS